MKLLEKSTESINLNHLNSLQNEPFVASKTEIEIKKVESISNNLFQMLKTIQEIQIFSNETKLLNPPLKNS